MLFVGVLILLWMHAVIYVQYMPHFQVGKKVYKLSPHICSLYRKMTSHKSHFTFIMHNCFCKADYHDNVDFFVKGSVMLEG